MKTKGKFHFSAAHSNLTMLQTNTNAAQAVQSITLAQQLKRSSAAPTNHNNSSNPRLTANEAGSTMGNSQ
jgi:hypothetical protein